MLDVAKYTPVSYISPHDFGAPFASSHNISFIHKGVFMNETFPQHFQSATHAAIEYLSRPGSTFGTEPDDVALLQNPEALRESVHLQIEGSRSSDEVLSSLISRLEEVNWPAVAQELRLRLKMTDGFFDEDLPSHAVA
jgi:hypothetical protein